MRIQPIDLSAHRNAQMGVKMIKEKNKEVSKDLAIIDFKSAKENPGHKNEMEICFDAVSINESFARVAVAAFVSRLNPTLEEISDIKTAVSEAVTNSIIHGYGNYFGYGQHGNNIPAYQKVNGGKVRIHCLLEDGVLHIEVADNGRGIENIEQAMEPLFTTKPELERSGMGFAFMEAFMDELQVDSIPGKGTKVCMCKKISAGPWIGDDDGE